VQQVFEIQKDTLGSANWVIGSRTADRSCILTMGVNFGVHAASCKLGVIPDVFCCDVDIPGKSDLKTHLEQTQAYHASMLKMAYRFVEIEEHLKVASS
jgi:hypothetical protein